MPLDLAEFAPYDSAGSAVVTGLAQVETLIGTVRRPMQSPVMMVPITRYTTAWWTREVIRAASLRVPDERMNRYVRKTYVDGRGRFTFRHCAPGEYYVVTRIEWSQMPSMAMREFPSRTEQVLVGGVVHVGPGQQTDMVLERLDRPRAH